VGGSLGAARRRCGGMLKPAVIFFGDVVSPAIKRQVNKQVENAEGLLVVGSSLEVFSAYRLVKLALDREVPVAIVNKGVTRLEREGLGDMVLKLDARAGHILKGLERRALQRGGERKLLSG